MLLTNKDYKMLSRFLTLREQETKELMYKYLKRYYKKVINTPSYLMAEGDIPVVLLAHLDTVDEKRTKYEMIYDPKKEIIASLYSLGFDDKAGLVAILKILEAGYRPSVVCCTGEEIGCVGAEQLVRDYPDCPFAEKPKYLIQLDRRGLTDCVFYDCDNTDFIKYIESFGYFKEAFGSFTDICTIAPSWGMSAVNLSIGYYNEHSRDEYLDVRGWLTSIEQTQIILDDAQKAPFFKYEEKYVDRKYSSVLGAYDYFDQDAIDVCDICGAIKPVQEMFEVVKANGEIICSCVHCLNGKYDFCQECNCFYEPIDDHTKRCYWCEQEARGAFRGVY